MRASTRGVWTCAGSQSLPLARLTRAMAMGSRPVPIRVDPHGGQQNSVFLWEGREGGWVSRARDRGDPREGNI